MPFGEYELSPSLIGLSLLHLSLIHISEPTRQAFHSYTHLIGKLFNAYPFGPPSRVTGTSSWTCVDHSVSRLPPVTMAPVSDSLSLRLRDSEVT